MQRLYDSHGWYYLSFVDDKWLGAAVVPGNSQIEALHNSWLLGCNPGGQVLCMPLGEIELKLFPPEKRRRLLSEADIPGARRVTPYNH